MNCGVWLLCAIAAGCTEGAGAVSVSTEPNVAGSISAPAALPGSDGSVPDAAAPVAADAGRSTAMSSRDSGPMDAALSVDSGSPSDAAVIAPMDAAKPSDATPIKPVRDLAQQVLAAWGSSVCAGTGATPNGGWAWALEKKLAEIKGPKVSHVSTGGHVTDSKETQTERNKVKSANFVVVCLSLGNQGLGSTATDASAKMVVDSYLDDIFTDDDDKDGDPESMVHYIESLNAAPIVTLVYPMADYTAMHCHHVVEANILQQSYGVPTINFLGPTNAGNNFGPGDCNWADGRNAPANVKFDARHPNQLGHTESFYAFPPDLPFALASGIAFPVRPPASEGLVLSRDAAAGGAPVQSTEPIRYAPEHAIHSYTMQFSFQTSSDGTLAAIALQTKGFLTLELKNGVIHLITADGADALASTRPVADGAWHDAALTYSYVRQKLALYVDGALMGEPDTAEGASLRELFPESFVLGGPATSGRTAAPPVMRVKDLFINRTTLHAREIEERSKTDWVGAGSLDIYAPLRPGSPTENRAQTLQTIRIQD